LQNDNQYPKIHFDFSVEQLYKNKSQEAILTSIYNLF